MQEPVNPIEYLEYGFVLACERHEETYRRWRSLHGKLEAMQREPIAHDAGVGDGRIDCLLREMENDQLSFVRETGVSGGYPFSRTRLQIQLTRYWIVSAGEMLRSVRKATEEGHPNRSKLSKLTQRFGAYRMMISKQTPQQGSKKNRPITLPDGEEYRGEGFYAVKPMIDNETGSIGFVVYDGESKQKRDEPRKALSDMLLDFGESLPDPKAV
ncbi:hypothetical protein [Parasedimentitalea denitrificans]|uniref:hypothetical protein n=1 Tax=Parasedimentitalea denitrificans TaxID=2211118 RepID=UPI00197D654C|nr:hypothetical protein [Sedimentitalea sp. CY04]